MAVTILEDNHLIPKALQNHLALQDPDGFDIDAPSNRLYLPTEPGVAGNMGSSSHDGFNAVHLNYNRGVDQALNDLLVITDPATRASAVADFQASVRVALANGDLFAGPAAGVEDDQAILRSNNFFGDWTRYAADHPDQIQQNNDIAQQGRATIITRHGRPVAALVPIEAYGDAIRQQPLMPVAGSGRRLWGKNSTRALRKLRDEWSR